MIDREVQKIEVDCEGNIIALINQFMGWSPLSIEDVIRHIEGGIFQYHAVFPIIGKVRLQVIHEGNGKKIITDPTRSSRNLLYDLPIYSVD